MWNLEKWKHYHKYIVFRCHHHHNNNRPEPNLKIFPLKSNDDCNVPGLFFYIIIVFGETYIYTYNNDNDDNFLDQYDDILSSSSSSDNNPK